MKLYKFYHCKDWEIVYFPFKMEMRHDEPCYWCVIYDYGHMFQKRIKTDMLVFILGDPVKPDPLLQSDEKILNMNHFFEYIFSNQFQKDCDDDENKYHEFEIHPDHQILYDVLNGRCEYKDGKIIKIKE